MKKFISSLILGSLLALAPMGQAQTTVALFLVNSNVVTNLFIGGGITVKRVTVSANGSLPAFYFFDYNTNGGLSLSSLQYSNTTSFSNLVTVSPYTNSVVFTNSLGQTATNLYVGQYSYFTNVATATASNAIQIGAVASANGIPYTVDVGWNIIKGLTVRGTNNANAAIYIEYQ